jgi:hypothetical protein
MKTSASEGKWLLVWIENVPDRCGPVVQPRSIDLGVTTKEEATTKAIVIWDDIVQKEHEQAEKEKMRRVPDCSQRPFGGIEPEPRIIFEMKIITK